MLMVLLRRTSRRLHRSFSSAAAVLPTTTPTSSNLHTEYKFTPPPSLHKNPKPKTPTFDNTTHKKEKPPYRPPSSLDRSGKKPVKSDLPFDFRFSYTESSETVRPIGLREPKYSPFGPERVDRVWTGVCAPAVDPKAGKEEAEKLVEKRKEIRESIQGHELTNAERMALVERYSKHKTKRQINLGRDGLTHNMLNDIHNNWKHAEAVRIKCMGVPTVDMKNVCTQLEDKTFGKIIHRHGGLLVLYRGRNYNPKKRPVIPLMLWKPHEPIYPKLIKTTIDGLSIGETKAMRKKGLAVPALTKLGKNGYYGGLLPMVRDAFLVAELVRIDCRGLERKDYKKIGCKLRDLIPCILVTFEKEQIVVWRGKDYKPHEGRYFLTERELFDNSGSDSARDSRKENPCSDSARDSRKENSCSDSAGDAGSGQEPADENQCRVPLDSNEKQVTTVLTAKLELDRFLSSSFPLEEKNL